VTAITPFTFPATGQPVRSVAIDGEPWFVGADVTEILGYANGSRDINRHVPERHRRLYRIGTPSGEQQMSVIDEPGAYRLIMRSNQAQAEAFQDWLAEEVIPAIRRTGSYSAAARFEIPRTYADALRAAADASERAELAEAKVAELEPSAHAWDVLADAHGDYSVRDAAQILDRDPLISIGQNRLFAKLRELGWIDANGRPYQAQVDNGRLVRRPTSYTHPHTNEPVLTSQVRITVKGLRELHKQLGGFGADGGLVGAAA
jgi:anti-repressor protein